MKESIPSLQQKIQWLLEDLRTCQPEKIILFGSAARGDADDSSDLDVVVVKQTPLRFIQRGLELVGCLRSEVFPVDLLVYTPEEFDRMVREGNPFIESVLSDGKVLYEKAA